MSLAIVPFASIIVSHDVVSPTSPLIDADPFRVPLKKDALCPSGALIVASGLISIGRGFERGKRARSARKGYRRPAISIETLRTQRSTD